METVRRDPRTLDQLGAIGTVLEVGLERVLALAGGVGDGRLVDDGLGVLVRHGYFVGGVDGRRGIWYLMLERGELSAGSGEAGVYGFVSPCFCCVG